MTVTYAVEPFAEFFADAKDVLRRHWQEIAVHKDILLDPDVSFYESAQKLGILVIYTAREGNELVGYTIYFVRGRHHHYNVGFALNDICYIAPEHRRNGVASSLFDFAEADLRRRGAAIVLTNAKVSHPALGSMLHSRGYRHTEDGYTKRL